MIRYSTAVSLLHKVREFGEWIIDTPHPNTDGKQPPRTYRVKARKGYLATAKQQQRSAKQRRRRIKLQFG